MKPNVVFFSKVITEICHHLNKVRPKVNEAQGYLAYKKPHHPRTLQQAYAWGSYGGPRGLVVFLLARYPFKEMPKNSPQRCT